MKSKRERKAAVVQRRAQLDSVARCFTLNPVQAYGVAVGGMMLWLRLLARQRVKLSLAKAQRRDTMMRLSGPTVEPTAREVANAEARDTLRHDRIDRAYRYERSAHRPLAAGAVSEAYAAHTYSALPNVQHSGSKKARDASKIDTSKVTVREYQPKAFNAKNGEFGCWGVRRAPQYTVILSRMLDELSSGQIDRSGSKVSEAAE